MPTSVTKCEIAARRAALGEAATEAGLSLAQVSELSKPTWEQKLAACQALVAWLHRVNHHDLTLPARVGLGGIGLKDFGLPSAWTGEGRYFGRLNGK